MKKRPGRHFLEPSEIHKNAPAELVQAYIDARCNQHELSRRLQVNDFYVNQLLRKGIEPSNLDIREKLFLPRRTKRTPKPEEWDGQKQIKRRINRMARQTKEALEVTG
jgi:hypothetical protein